MWPAIIISACALAGLLALLAWQRRRHEAAEARARLWERVANESANTWRRLLAQPGEVGPILQALAELSLQQLGADGALVWQAAELPTASATPGAAPAAPGTKPPALGPLSLSLGVGLWRAPAAQAAAMPGPPAPDDFFWSRRPLLRSPEQMVDWLPNHASQQAPGSALLAPVRLPAGEAYLLITRGRHLPALATLEQELLAVLVAHAELALQVRGAQQARQAMAHALQTAHEDGMLQISRGIIHNLGNGLTAVQLAIENLRGGEEAASGELLALLRDEVLPRIEAARGVGTATDNGAEAQCRTCLEALRAGLDQLLSNHQQTNGALREIERKFHEITDIIALQQQFIGELGTENVVPLAGVLRDVGRLCAPALTQRSIQLELDTQVTGQVLVDPAMLRHILTLLVKQGIEAVSAARRAQPRLRLAVGRHLEDGHFLRVTVEDNAGGGDLTGGGDQDTGASANRERQDEWQFCLDRVAKYGGRLSRQAQLGQGTVICLDLPEVAGRVAREESSAAASPATPATATPQP